MRRRLTAVFLVQRIGPYHHARLCAWAVASKHEIVVIEFRAKDDVYAWATVDECKLYQRHQTGSKPELLQALEKYRPEVIVCVGYADPEISQAVTWALGRRVSLVTCSDSTYLDEPRSWVKEALKHRVVAAFDAALVAGERAQNYLASLGLEISRQFSPWDVVDNSYFDAGADLVRNDAEGWRARLKLPSRYFLCVARFVPKKNLVRLIEAYAQYAGRAGADAWSLVLSGSGPEEAELRRCVNAASLEAKVFFPGFLQYADLPACYGLAGTFVLPSLSDQWGLVVNEAMAAGLPVLVSDRCGCAPDLVHEGENGFTFDPEIGEALAGRMKQMAEMNQSRRAAMSRRSREIVTAYSPASFAVGLEGAIECALARSRNRATWLTRLFAQSLAMRKVYPT